MTADEKSARVDALDDLQEVLAYRQTDEQK